VIDGVQCRSLGSGLAASAFVRLYPVALTKWRLRFADAVGQIYDFPVTDSGVAGQDAPTVGPVAASIAAAKADKAQILLRIGLARAFDGDGKFSPKRCYVQANGIVFQG